jgi:hypothetical protein
MIAFRATLPTNEQQMLDELVDAVSTAQAPADVEAYWYITPTIGPNTIGTSPTTGPNTTIGTNAAMNGDVWAPYRNSATYTGMRAGGY